MEEKLKLVILGLLLLGLGYMSYKIVFPFFAYIILGLLLAFLFFPLYSMAKRDTNETFAAILSIVTVLLLIILPSVWVTTNLITQATSAYQTVNERGITITLIASYIPGVEAEDILGVIPSTDTLVAKIPDLITGTGEFFLGLVILFIVMYYALKEGDAWYATAIRALPIKQHQKHRLRDEIKDMTKALFYGQVLTALLIGVLCGVVFWMFGLPDPVFWGFVMMLFAFLPLLGAPIVYIPAGIILIINDAVLEGIGVIALCTLVIFFAEYIVRPKFVSSSTELHPLTVIIGAIGGIYALGFVGFLIGPLILGIFITVLSFEITT